MSLFADIRQCAVDNVDRRHGYTYEHAPDQRQHLIEYDEEEARLAADPGAFLCPHANRIHSMGAGILVCFECWVSPLIGHSVGFVR